MFDRIDWIDASLFADLPCLKNDVIVNVDELANVSDVIECLRIGNYCLNELNEIDFYRFANVRLIDVGVNSLVKMNNVLISSLMIYDWLIWSS